jgi:hypothetical protein
MPIKLHRCRITFTKAGGRPCWRAQEALDDAGVAYEVVKHPVLRRNRDDYETLTGQKLLPASELEDGTILHEESKCLVAQIREHSLPRPPQRGMTGSGQCPFRS